MEYISFNLTSKFDDLILDAIVVKDNDVKAIVQFAHGMCEHKERYLPFMEFLAKQGYLCVMHDHRCMGKVLKVKKI